MAKLARERKFLNMKATSLQFRFLFFLISSMIISFLLYTYGGLLGLAQENSGVVIKNHTSLPQESHGVEIKNHTSLGLFQKNSGVEIKNHTSLDLPQKGSGVEIKYHTGQDLANSHGYMLALSYSDQITDATGTNLRSLLCLAKRMGGVRVVEPFIYGSYLGLNVSANWTREMRMTDIFDYSVWKQKTPFKEYGDFVPFKTFMANAPRKLVVVQYCTGLSRCRPCGHEDIISKGRIFCELNDFQLVGHECLTYGRERVLSLSSIETQLYSNYSKSEVVLMFDLYGGTLNQAYGQRYGYRLYAKECGRFQTRDYSALAPSQSIVADTDRYIQKYLKGLHYISIMIRIQFVFLKTNTAVKNQPTVAKSCLDNILKRLTKIKKETGIDHVFLTLDVGHYGSSIFREYITEETKLVDRYIEKFMSTIYKRNTTINEWEKEFTSISGIKHPGYISVLQKEIAAKGDVLVLVGPASTYQRSARIRYEKLHSTRKVIDLDRKCQ